jgi:hypothetical protein
MHSEEVNNFYKILRSGEKKIPHKKFGLNIVIKTPFSRPLQRWKDNIDIYLSEI